MSEDNNTTQLDEQTLPENEGELETNADDGDFGVQDEGVTDEAATENVDDGYEDGEESYDDYAEEPAEMKQEWSDSIVASKRVKREEMRRRLKKAMLFMLVFALVVTSIVYVMLLFIEENNVRITANSNNSDKSITLSMDNEYWTPFLNPRGPKNLWDVSYNPDYGREKIDTIEEVEARIDAAEVQVGTDHGDNYIRFVFMLRNNGKADATLNYEMTLEYEKEHNLQNAVRVMWGESFKHNDQTVTRGTVEIYAALSYNPRLEGTNKNLDRTLETGFIEYVAYPTEVEDPSFSLVDFERQSDSAEAAQKGYVSTTPFESDEFVFQKTNTLPVGDVMYCYVCIWLEGSDFDCVDAALGGYVKLGINFLAA